VTQDPLARAHSHGAGGLRTNAALQGMSGEDMGGSKWCRPERLPSTAASGRTGR